MDCVGVVADAEVGVVTFGGGGACRVGRFTGRVQQFKLVKFNVVGGGTLRCIFDIAVAVICSLSVGFDSLAAVVVVVIGCCCDWCDSLRFCVAVAFFLFG